MKKDIIGDSVFYSIEWSEFYQYDRFSAARILPDMPGIIQLADVKKSMRRDLFLFAAWREGLRCGMKNLFDADRSTLAATVSQMVETNLHYRYTVIDTSPSDMQDILFWLIRNYEPEYNNMDYCDSKRYREISIREEIKGKDGISKIITRC